MARGRPKTEKTDTKGTHLTAFLDIDTKSQFDTYCKTLDINASQLIRRLIRDELTNQRWGSLNNVQR
jgi:hypothetical protein